MAGGLNRDGGKPLFPMIPSLPPGEPDPPKPAVDQTRSPIAATKKGVVVKIGRETKGRRGAGVTLVTGLPLTGSLLEDVGRHLKTRCGTGGTVKDGVVEIQGDMRDRVAEELQKLGYQTKFAGG